MTQTTSKQESSFLPVYDFSPTVNANYLKQILPLMVRHNVAANSINYAIWYDYVLGSNPGLSKAVDNTLAENKAFDSETSIGLYKQHVCNVSVESFEKINLQIQKVIAHATNSINDTYSKAEETNDSFQKKTAILETLSEAPVINRILQEIIAETKSLSETSQVMQAKLNEANEEMDLLRLELNQVRQLAVTDGLTGLLNRRAFDQALLEVIRRSDAEITCLSILDIDHFKRVNDSYGHTIGDNVIKFVASIMKKHADEHHHVARFGGEEMAIIMPNTSKARAIEIAEKIRTTMESSRLKRKDNSQSLGVITLSVGIAQLQVGDDSESIVVRADKALYTAKETGRNKVIIGE